MPKYRIYAGIDTAKFQYSIDLPNHYEAEEEAYERAVEIYQAWEGLNGLPSWEQIRESLEKAGAYEEEVTYFYEQELEKHIAYYYEVEN